MPTREHPLDHAIVIGGSIAGLLAGRVLSDSFQQVTIIERDRYPDQPAPRDGVPQSRFLHVLLQRGQTILEDLFPDLAAELMAQGAPLLKDSQDVEFYSRYGTAKKDNSPIETLSATRGLLDWAIRQRLMQRSNITFLEHAQVVGLVAKPNRRGIAGVSVRQHSGGRSSTQTSSRSLLADLVVDASGKTSKTPQWLQQLGYDAPAETLIDAKIGYAHRIYQRPTCTSRQWQAAIAWPSLPTQTRSGILFPVEGNRWIVGLGGAAPDHPPTDEADFLEYARSLPTPLIYEAMKASKPLSPVYLYCGNENRKRDYEKLTPYPENLLVMGHASCAFNPVYAQGMTMSAIEAQILATQLKHPSAMRYSGWCQRVQQKLASAEAMPWSMATDMDRRYLTQDQSANRLQRFSDWYQEQILQLVTKDAAAYRQMMAVTHMLKSPNSMMAPSLLGKVVYQALTTAFVNKKQQTVITS